MLLRVLIVCLCILSTLQVMGNKANSDSILIVLDYPIKNGNDYFQRLSYEGFADTTLAIHIDCYYLRNGQDSVHVYDLSFDNLRFHAGATYMDLPFSKSLSRVKTDADYLDVVNRFQMVPAGQYHTRLSFSASGQKDSAFLDRNIIQFADSNLSYGSGLRSKMNAAIALPAKEQSHLQVQARNKQTKKSAHVEEARIKAADNKMKRQLRSIKGLDMRNVQLNGKTYSEAWYKDFFLGRYELASVQELNERAAKESKALSSNASSMVNNELESFRSVGSQLKELNSQSKSETKVKGQFDVNTYRSTAQDPQSAIQQNYTEFNANMDLELMGMPFSVEGFYTTQDANRKAKASYIRFHYDIESAKNKLQKTIDGYKSKLSETMSKGAGLENVYGNYAQGLDKQKAALLKNMSREYGVSPEVITQSEGNVDKIITSLPTDTAALLNATTDNIPGVGKSTQSIAAKKQKLQEHKKDIAERYQKILELEQKADKYYKLLERYRTQTHLDSAINYQKMAGLDSKDPSYKDMSKAAAGILPEGKAKNFVTGLTNFDAGIINKYESNYTMSGQTLKGLSMGYDLGVFKTGVTLGSTEYVSRDGNMDHYSTMLLRVDNKGSKNHKIGLLYNMTTPANSMSLDENFIGKQSIRYPGFSKPNQILSLVYEGKIGKQLQIKSENASSFKSGQHTGLDMAHAALNNSIAYNIPKTTLNLNVAWEHLGNAFENNTLPYIRSGTERYTLGTSMDLFQSFLSLKLDYNYLLQQSFSSTGYNRKWGIDLKTHSKRYPTVSLSYKPFSTFRSMSDTLQIAQRPIQGEVWTARSSYQFKRNKRIHRFTLLYNRNSSTADTIQYNSSTAQASYTYTDNQNKLSVNATLGRITLPVNYADGTGMISSYTAGASVSKAIGKNINLNLGPDIALCAWGLQRLSGTAGIVYRLQKYPFAFRTTLRYSSYRLSQTAVSQSLYAGQFGMSWQFKSRSKVKT